MLPKMKNLKMVLFVLRREGYHVQGAVNGIEALTEMERSSADMVVLDIRIVHRVSILQCPQIGIPLQMTNEQLALVIHPKSNEEILQQSLRLLYMPEIWDRANETYSKFSGQSVDPY
jgi:response regulator RpfG family c-di-GMP phosphodiesterase